jgi:hypothetical protein
MILVCGPTWNSQVEPTGLMGLAIFPEDKKTEGLLITVFVGTCRDKASFQITID